MPDPLQRDQLHNRATYSQKSTGSQRSTTIFQRREHGIFTLFDISCQVRNHNHNVAQAPDLLNTSSSHSSYTSHSEVYLESCTEENEGMFSKFLEDHAPMLSLL